MVVKEGKNWSMMKRIREVIEYTRTSIKNNLNSPILINNHELYSIDVNKGRIHKEFMYFHRTLSNSIKTDDKLR